MEIRQRDQIGRIILSQPIIGAAYSRENQVLSSLTRNFFLYTNSYMYMHTSDT